MGDALDGHDGLPLRSRHGVLQRALRLVELGRRGLERVAELLLLAPQLLAPVGRGVALLPQRGAHGARLLGLGPLRLQPLPTFGGRGGRLVLPRLRLLEVLLQRRRLLLLPLDLGAQLGRLLVEVLVPLLPRLELRRARLLRVELLHLGVRSIAPLELLRGLHHLGLDVGRPPLHLRLRLGHLPIEGLELTLGGQRRCRARLAVVARLLHGHLAARHALEQLLLLVRRGAALGLQQRELGADALELLLGVLDAPLVRVRVRLSGEW